ncbi:hypothetical protein ASD83_05025 [Devosia sp. Root685]|nr:hypothetical protein ASD83_05025 [Devosia sp. Root685]
MLVFLSHPSADTAATLQAVLFSGVVDWVGQLPVPTTLMGQVDAPTAEQLAGLAIARIQTSFRW